MATCQQCKKSLPPDATNGICPSCVLALARGQVPLGVEATRPIKAEEEIFPTAEELNRMLPNYRVERVLGQGGMGAVYLAHQPSLDRKVAIKIMSRRFAHDPSFAERFAREARTMARLNHQNIVNVYDYGQAGSACYLVMEYVDGVNLRQAMREGNLRAEQGLAIVPQVCEALQYAHDEGIVHRDIKPENILIDKKSRVKIADFGLAKLVDDDQPSLTLTGSRQLLGTLSYMAPEQIERPTAVDHRADIYSLGVVLYELLTGELPLGRFQLPGEKFPGHAALDDVVVRTLEKQPDRRFQQASEVRTAVEVARHNASFEPAPAVLPDVAAAATLPREGLVNRPASPVKNLYGTAAFPSVPFEIENPWHGMTVTKGIMSVQPEGISISYSKRENVFNSNLLSESGTHLIPYQLVRRVEFKERWFSHSIILKLDTFDDYAALFAEEPGTLVFKIKSCEEDEIREVVNAIRAKKGHSPLPFLSIKPEEKRNRAQKRVLFPSIGLLLAGIVNMAVLPIILAMAYVAGTDSKREPEPTPTSISAPSVSAPLAAETGGLAPVPETGQLPAANQAVSKVDSQSATSKTTSKARTTRLSFGIWSLELADRSIIGNSVSGAIFTIVGLLICSGGFSMMLLRNWGWCVAMSILALIPIHPGALIGIPAGIAGLIQLNRNCNSSQFEKN
jgi:serine/threonine protein kinase